MADQYLYLFFLMIIPFILLLLFLTCIIRPRRVKIPIKSRHVFITGGSMGIGLAMAHLAASEGAHVSILARSERKLEEAKQAIKASTGAEVATFSADVRDFSAVQKAVDKADPIDVLVVNQGIFKAEELEKLQLDDVKLMIDVNLMGSFNVIKAALPGMKGRADRRPVSVALMSSQAGQVGIYGYTAYAATKFGLRGLAEALQQEVIGDGIHVSLICPPDTDTDSLLEDRKGRPEPTNIIAAPSGTLMKVDEVAMKAMAGVKNGSFVINCNFEGFLLALATAGLSPPGSPFVAFVEVISMGVLRIVGLCYIWSWYGSIQRWRDAQRK